MPIGTLYGLGVGPGDPDLLTIKAAKILQKVDLVYTAASPGNDYSIAQNIAAPHLKAGTEIKRLDFPMSGEKETWEAAWKIAAAEVAAFLKTGKSAAFLTLGDAMTYSTYSYILPYLAEVIPAENVVTIPGISSYQLAASRINTPLVTGLESLTVMSGVEDPEILSNILDTTDNVAILKTYRSYSKIIEMLRRKGLADKAILCSKVGLPDEEIHRDLLNHPIDKPPYLSLMIVKKGEK